MALPLDEPCIPFINTMTAYDKMQGQVVNNHIIHLNLQEYPGLLFTKKMPSNQYRDSHYKPETVVGPS